MSDEEHQMNVTFDRPGPSSQNDEMTSGVRPARLESPRFHAKKGDLIVGKYEVLSSELLGSGTFATVHWALDVENNTNVALKITKKNSHFYEIAQGEIQVLESLADADRDLARNLFSELLDKFVLNQQQCIVFPLYGKSILDHISRNQYRGFPLRQAIHITYQLTAAVQFMHHIGLIHTDIKAENVFIVNEEHTLKGDDYRLLNSVEVRLGDFNSASNVIQDDKKSLVQTKNYRAPEVIGGMGFTEAIDIWSVGCLMYELIVGELLLECEVEVENTSDLAVREKKRFLQLCESVTTLLPQKFQEKCKKNIPDLNDFREKKFEYEKYTYKGNREDMLNKMLLAIPSDKDDLDLHYYHLLRRMMEVPAESRITAAEALRHPLFRKLDDSKRFDMSNPIFEQNLRKPTRFADRIAQFKATNG